MATGGYSFIDIAVLDPVRMRFVAADALAILTTGLDRIVWANGPGAELFGSRDVEAVMDAAADLGGAATRQIRSVPGYPAIGQNRPLVIRMARGLTSRPISFEASGIVLPDGEPAILLAATLPESSALDPQGIAGRAISGLGGAETFAALIDGNGRVTAASRGFDDLAITDETLNALIRDVRFEEDRLVKRLVPAGAARLPAGFARLNDDPATHLLLVVETDPAVAAQDASQVPRSGRSGDPGHQPLPQDNRPALAEAPGAGTARAQRTSASGVDQWYFNGSPGPARPGGDPPGPMDRAEDLGVPGSHTVHTGPIRFVWRTDSECRLSVISDEFVQAIGTSAGELIGRRFDEVAEALGLDPDREIAGLMERRDTWSGRTVMWPLGASGLRVPVDLAALPVYARDRSFQGFRGFGVVRPDDRVSTPGKIRPDPGGQGSAGAGAGAGDGDRAENEAQDPFRGETPALIIDNTPERRSSDKVIRLAEHRPASSGRSLSAVEQIAFREIGERLKKESASGSEPQETGAEPEAGTAPVDDPTAEAMQARAPGQGNPADTAETEEDPTGQDAADGDDVEGDVLAGKEGGRGAGLGSAPAALAAGGPVVPAAFFDRRREAASAGVDLSILSRLPIPIIIHSVDRLHYVNREFLELTGYGSLDAFERAGGLHALFDDPGQDDSRADRRLRLRCQDGQVRPVQALLQSVPWKGARALLLAFRPDPFGERVEDASQAGPGQSWQARVEQLNAIVDTATDGVVLIAPDGTIRSLSRPAEALFGMDTAQVAGRPFTCLFAIESQRAASDYLSGLSGNGVASVLNDGREVIGREAKGRFIPLFMTIGRLPGDGGFCAVLRDVTHWKRAEEELTQARTLAERASSQKTNFLARVSHEIRTPLNAIIGFSELMLDEKFGPIANDRYRDYLHDINRSGNHVLDLVNDLLDISKIEAGELELSYEAVSLNEALAGAVAMMQPQANRERVIIRSSFASRLPDIVADLRSIRQIALNLLANAIRFTQAGGQVIVSTAYEEAGDIVMRVRDTGIGMSHGEIEQALKPFKQINTIKRGRGDGTGLGLPLTKAMVEANRARFAISSTPGSGTMVEVTFPATRVLAE